MDTMINKKYLQYDYRCRYSDIPTFFDTTKKREVYGIGENLLKDTPYVSHKVVSTDTLDSLALKYYNNPTYWWAIAYFNDIQDSFTRLVDKFEIIKIPSISAISFGEVR